MKFPFTCSVIVPVYRGAETIAELAAQLVQTLEGCVPDYEIVFVNDGSPDNSWEVITQLTQRYSQVSGINLLRNYGQHNALLCGIRQARGEVIVTLDDDLQNPPAEIPRLLDKLAGGWDVVYGTPAQEQHGLWRDLASQVTKLALQSTMGVDTARQVSAFRAFRSAVRQGFAEYHSPSVSIDVLLTWGAARFAAVPVAHHPRHAGQSNYTFRKLVRHAMNMVTGFSILPLQFASLMGFLFAIFGLVVLVYVVGRYLIQGGSVPGFPFLASTVAIFSGVQLFALGIMGEYLARMHFRLQDRPAYVISEQTIATNAPMPVPTPDRTQ
ncbi:MAG TPA: glycosyltransferase family 2 protein [Anaerolineales bacterium]|nr:glycosyltransferase family 2 protein [Anaerolineales bacterium]